MQVRVRLLRAASLRRGAQMQLRLLTAAVAEVIERKSLGSTRESLQILIAI